MTTQTNTIDPNTFSYRYNTSPRYWRNLCDFVEAMVAEDGLIPLVDIRRKYRGVSEFQLDCLQRRGLLTWKIERDVEVVAHDALGPFDTTMDIVSVTISR